MHNKIVENIYSNVDTILSVFNEHFPTEGSKILKNLHDVHDIPEIGEAIFQEEKDDISEIIRLLQLKKNLSEEEYLLLAEAKSLLTDIECKTSYISGMHRTNASHSIIFDYEGLRSLSSDLSYHHCLEYSFNKIKELFKSRFGVRSGTVIFNDTLNTLISTYYFTQIMDDMDDKCKQQVCDFIYDIALNISKDACKYLAKKDPDFKKIYERTNL